MSRIETFYLSVNRKRRKHDYDRLDVVGVKEKKIVYDINGCEELVVVRNDEIMKRIWKRRKM